MTTFQSTRETSTPLAAARGCKRCCLFLAVWLWVPSFRPHLSFVGTTVAPFRPGETPPATTRFVREKKGSLWRRNGDAKASKGGRSRRSRRSRAVAQMAPDGVKAAQMLTASIKKAQTAADLLGVLDEAVNSPYFNYFHVSAAYTSLVSFHRGRALLPSSAESPVLQKLHVQTETLITLKQINPQASANVLWAITALFEAIPGTTQLLPALINLFPETVPGMKAQELANCVWASAQLKDVAPDVLKVVPALISQIPGKALDMKPQELSNSLWASAHLKDVAPDVLKFVPAIVAHIPGKADGMDPQGLSNCLWASVQLKDVAPDVLRVVPALIAQIPSKAGEMIPQHLSNCLWASAHLKDVAPDVLRVVPALIAQIPSKAGDMKPQHLSNCLWASAQLKDVAPQMC